MNEIFIRDFSLECVIYVVFVLLIVFVSFFVFYVLWKRKKNEEEQIKIQELREMRRNLEQMSDVELKLFYGSFCKNKHKLIAFSIEHQSLLESEMLRRKFTLTSKYRIKT